MRINIYYKDGKVVRFTAASISTAEQAGRLYWATIREEGYKRYLLLSEIANISITPEEDDIEGPEVVK